MELGVKGNKLIAKDGRLAEGCRCCFCQELSLSGDTGADFCTQYDITYERPWVNFIGVAPPRLFQSVSSIGVRLELTRTTEYDASAQELFPDRIAAESAVFEGTATKTPKAFYLNGSAVTDARIEGNFGGDFACAPTNFQNYNVNPTTWVVFFAYRMAAADPAWSLHVERTASFVSATAPHEPPASFTWASANSFLFQPRALNQPVGCGSMVAIQYEATLTLTLT